MLYLRGLSTGDFSEALKALLGPEAAGFSASTVTCLLKVWQDEYQVWHKRSLEGRDYVYILRRSRGAAGQPISARLD